MSRKPAVIRRDPGQGVRNELSPSVVSAGAHIWQTGSLKSGMVC